MVHELKCWPEYFEAVISGAKTFEVRKNDRDFRVGDVLLLNEYGPFSGYTGRETRQIVNYILPFSKIPGIEPVLNFCIMSIGYIPE